jgi:hypothetical protein
MRKVKSWLVWAGEGEQLVSPSPFCGRVTGLLYMLSPSCGGSFPGLLPKRETKKKQLEN